MKLEQIVTSSELSKRLKELGMPQDSVFEYQYSINENNKPVLGLKGSLSVWNQSASAFTTDELLEILEPYYYGNEQDFGWWLLKHSGNKADRLAEKLIHLLENKLITLEGGK